MTATGHVVIVGGSLGGLRAAEQLRAAGWRGELTVVGEEPHPPYNRPPLSKQLLAGEATAASLALRPRASVSDVRWRYGVAAVRASLADREVTLAGGERLRFDGLVVATGLRPRRLACPGPEPGRFRVRTLDDAQRLRAALARPIGRQRVERSGARGQAAGISKNAAGVSKNRVRVVVVGAGFIGCEVAATAIGLGCADVTVVASERLPMLRPLGELLAAELLRRHRERGVRFLGKRTVVRFEGEDRVTGVVLDDGTRLPADVVVEAIGSVANTEWLAGNQLDLSDGVLCDEHLRVEGLRYAVAVGDVARFPNARYDRVPRRVGHWSTPVETAKHAARTLVAGLHGAGLHGAELHGAVLTSPPFAPLPSYWSDQYDFRLQSFGAPPLGVGDVRILAGDLTGEPVVGYHAAGRLVGVVALGGPGPGGGPGGDGRAGARAAAAAARYRTALLAT